MPLTPRHMAVLAAQALKSSDLALAQSRAFLQKDLPLRLGRFATALGELPSLPAQSDSLVRMIGNCQSSINRISRMQTSQPNQIFNDEMADVQRWLEFDLSALTSDALRHVSMPMPATASVRLAVNRTLDVSLYHSLRLRMLLQEHARLGSPSSIGTLHLGPFLRDTIGQVESFCIEKNGTPISECLDSY